MSGDKAFDVQEEFTALTMHVTWPHCIISYSIYHKLERLETILLAPLRDSIPHALRPPSYPKRVVISEPCR